MNNITLSEKPIHERHKVGNLYINTKSIDKEIYILVHAGNDFYALISLKNGHNWISAAKKCEDVFHGYEERFKRFYGDVTITANRYDC